MCLLHWPVAVLGGSGSCCSRSETCSKFLKCLQFVWCTSGVVCVYSVNFEGLVRRPEQCLLGQRDYARLSLH